MSIEKLAQEVIELSQQTYGQMSYLNNVLISLVKRIKTAENLHETTKEDALNVLNDFLKLNPDDLVKLHGVDRTKLGKEDDLYFQLIQITRTEEKSAAQKLVIFFFKQEKQEIRTLLTSLLADEWKNAITAQEAVPENVEVISTPKKKKKSGSVTTTPRKSIINTVDLSTEETAWATKVNELRSLYNDLTECGEVNFAEQKLQELTEKEEAFLIIIRYDQQLPSKSPKKMPTSEKIEVYCKENDALDILIAEAKAKLFPIQAKPTQDNLQKQLGTYKNRFAELKGSFDFKNNNEITKRVTKTITSTIKEINEQINALSQYELKVVLVKRDDIQASFSKLDSLLNSLNVLLIETKNKKEIAAAQSSVKEKITEHGQSFANDIKILKLKGQQLEQSVKAIADEALTQEIDSSNEDIDRLDQELANAQSVRPLEVGEKIKDYQLFFDILPTTIGTVKTEQARFETRVKEQLIKDIKAKAIIELPSKLLLVRQKYEELKQQYELLIGLNITKYSSKFDGETVKLKTKIDDVLLALESIGFPSIDNLNDLSLNELENRKASVEQVISKINSGSNAIKQIEADVQNLEMMKNYLLDKIKFLEQITNVKFTLELKQKLFHKLWPIAQHLEKLRLEDSGQEIIYIACMGMENPEMLLKCNKDALLTSICLINQALNGIEPSLSQNLNDKKLAIAAIYLSHLESNPMTQLQESNVSSLYQQYKKQAEAVKKVDAEAYQDQQKKIVKLGLQPAEAGRKWTQVLTDVDKIPANNSDVSENAKKLAAKVNAFERVREPLNDPTLIANPLQKLNKFNQAMGKAENKCLLEHSDSDLKVTIKNIALILACVFFGLPAWISKATRGSFEFWRPDSAIATKKCTEEAQEAINTPACTA